MFQIVSHSERETESAGEIIGKRLGKGGVLALFGGMGAGKTALTRGICRGLGSSDHVSSPTFAIVNEYKGERKIYHFDMYRITSPEDLESTGYYDYLDGESSVIIEWSENILPFLPENTVCGVLKKGETDNERVITLCMLSELGDVTV